MRKEADKPLDSANSLAIKNCRGYGVPVGAKIKSLSLVFLIFSLLFVVVGNYLSFHVDSHETKANYSISSQQDLLISENHMDHQDEDSCISGFCHLGHCAHLLLPKKVSDTIKIDLETSFFSRIDQPQQCDLEGPFQPPRTA